MSDSNSNSNNNGKLQLPVVLAIDPSNKDLGFACFDYNLQSDFYDIGDSLSWTFGLIHPKGGHIQYKWRDAYFQLKYWLEADKREVTHFVSEWPMFFDSVKGRIAAQQGYTNDIAAIAGYLTGAFNFKPNNVVLWTPMKWKGTATKYATSQKFARIFGERATRLARTLSDDVIDAIMVLEYWHRFYEEGRFDWQKKKHHSDEEEQEEIIAL
jgi:hypothetical protein